MLLCCMLLLCQVRELKKRQQKEREKEVKRREKQLEKEKGERAAQAKLKMEQEAYQLQVGNGVLRWGSITLRPFINCCLADACPVVL